MFRDLIGHLRNLLTPRGKARAVVVFDDTGVTCRRSDGTEEHVDWASLEAVEIVTTSGGPWVDDVFWVLRAGDRGCVVPSESESIAPLIERLQRLPGFDNRALIEAMGSVDDASFLCWRRPAR